MAADREGGELAPCPFCGARVTDQDTGAGDQDHGGPNERRFEMVVCPECSASGPESEGEPSAIAAWNLRSHPTREELEGLVKRWSDLAFAWDDGVRSNAYNICASELRAAMEGGQWTTEG